MADLDYLSALDIAAGVRAGALSALDVLDHHLDRVNRFNPDLNAVVVLDIEGARAAARRVDQCITEKVDPGPLAGVPMTVKESFNLTGTASTWGNPDWRDNIAATNAVAVDRLIAAGAVIYGKTNVPLMLADWQSYNDIYGTTNNPWDRARSPGGSSGGSGAALAAGLSALEIGTDIGGSVRNPANFNGLYGHKPTWGIVPLRGHAPPGIVTPSDISVAGPLARTIDDLEAGLNVLAGPDRLDAPGWTLDLKRPDWTSLSGRRIAIWADDPLSPVDASVGAAVQLVADTLGRAGAIVSDTARPDLDIADAYWSYVRLLNAVTSSRAPIEEFRRMQKEVAGLHEDATGFVANSMRGATLLHRDWLALNEARNKMRYAWADFFDDWDAIVMPINTTPPFLHDHRPDEERRLTVNGREVPYIDQIFWAGVVGMAYLPGTAIPVLKTPEGLPVGVQIVGRQLGDLQTIHLGRLLAPLLGGFTAPPGYT